MLVKDWSWLCCADLKQLYTHPPARQTPALICNLLFIAKRQRRRLGKADNLVAFPPSTPTPILSSGHCVGKQMEWLPFVVKEGGESFVFCAEFECRLAIQNTQAMTAGRIVQIMMHGRDQIKIYQLRVGIHLQIYFQQMKNWKGKGERVFWVRC